MSNVISHRNPYSENPIYSIANKLTMLSTVGDQARELIQNAEDAGATSVEFTINSESLTVQNDALFTFCENWMESVEEVQNCNPENPKRRFCDVHAIQQRDSRNKTPDPSSIGRFGIGFVSTFLFSDNPVVRSGNIQLRFDPRGVDKIQMNNDQRFTIVELPWALNSESELRKAVDKFPPRNTAELEAFAEEIEQALNTAIFFTKNIRNIRMKYGEIIVLDLSKEYDSQNQIMTTKDRKTNASQKYLILDNDVDSRERIDSERIKRSSSTSIEKTHSDIRILVPLNRQTEFNGQFFTLNATEMATGMPFHMNASFLLESSRKRFSVRSSALDEDSSWNRLLITEGARLIGDNLNLIENLSTELMWEILESAYLMKASSEGVQDGYKPIFWDEVSEMAKRSELFQCARGCKHRSSQIITYAGKVAKGEIEDWKGISNFLSVHFCLNLTLRRMQILEDLGSYQLSLLILKRILDQHKTSVKKLKELSEVHLYAFFVKVIDDLSRNEDFQASGLDTLPIWKDINGEFQNWVDLRNFSSEFEAEEVDKLLEIFDIHKPPHSVLQESKQLSKHLERISLDDFLACTESPDFSIRWERLYREDQRAFHETLDSLFKPLERSGFDRAQLDVFKHLPLWPTSKGNFENLMSVEMPSDFEDPLGIINLVKTSSLSSQTIDRLERKCDVKRINLRVYLESSLPRYLKETNLTLEQSEKLTEYLIQKFQGEDLGNLTTLKFLPNMSKSFNAPGEMVTPFIDKKIDPYEKCLTYIDTRNSPKYIDLNFVEKLIANSDEAKVFEFFSHLQMKNTFDLTTLHYAYLKLQADKHNQSEKEKIGKILLTQLLRFDDESLGNLSLHEWHFPCDQGCVSWHQGNQLAISEFKTLVCGKDTIHTLKFKLGILSQSKMDLIRSRFGFQTELPFEAVARHLEHLPNNVNLESEIDVRLPSPKSKNCVLYDYLEKQIENNPRIDISELSIYPILNRESISFHPPAGVFQKSLGRYDYLDEHLRVDRSNYFERLRDDYPYLVRSLKLTDEPQVENFDYFNSILSIETREIQHKYLTHLNELFITNQLDMHEISEYVLEHEFWTLSDDSDKKTKIFDSLANDHPSFCSKFDESEKSLVLDSPREVTQFLKSLGVSTVRESVSLNFESQIFDESENREMSETFRSLAPIISGVIRKKLSSEIATRDIPVDQLTLIKSLNKLRVLRASGMKELAFDFDLRTDFSPYRKISVKNLDLLYVPNHQGQPYIFHDSNIEDFRTLIVEVVEHFLNVFTQHDLNETIFNLTTSSDMPYEKAIQRLRENDLIDEVDTFETENPIDEAQDIHVLLGSRNVVNEAPDFDESDDLTVNDSEDDFEISGFSESQTEMTELSNTELAVKKSSQLEVAEDKQHRNESTSGTNIKDTTQIPTKLQISSGNNPYGPQTSGTGITQQTNGSLVNNPKKEHSRPIEDIIQDVSESRNSRRPRPLSGYVGVKSDEETKNDANFRNLTREEKAIEYIIKKDWIEHRDVENMNDEFANNPGYDLISIDKINDSNVRYIEVKSTGGAWPATIYVSKTQFEMNIRLGDEFWLYVVEYVDDLLTEEADTKPRTRLHRIQNPYSRISRFYFDEGWRTLAEPEVAQNPHILMPGMQVYHVEYGVGRISSEIKTQGLTLKLNVLFEDGIERPITWDDDIYLSKK